MGGGVHIYPHVTFKIDGIFHQGFARCLTSPALQVVEVQSEQYFPDAQSQSPRMLSPIDADATIPATLEDTQQQQPAVVVQPMVDESMEKLAKRDELLREAIRKPPVPSVPKGDWKLLPETRLDYAEKLAEELDENQINTLMQHFDGVAKGEVGCIDPAKLPEQDQLNFFTMLEDFVMSNRKKLPDPNAPPIKLKPLQPKESKPEVTPVVQMAESLQPAEPGQAATTKVPEPVQPAQPDVTTKVPVQPAQLDVTTKVPVQPAQPDVTTKVPVQPAQPDVTTKVPVQPAQLDVTPKVLVQPAQPDVTTKVPVQPAQPDVTTKVPEPVQPAQPDVTTKVPVQLAQPDVTTKVPEPAQSAQPDVTTKVPEPVQPAQPDVTTKVPVQPAEPDVTTKVQPPEPEAAVVPSADAQPAQPALQPSTPAVATGLPQHVPGAAEPAPAVISLKTAANVQSLAAQPNRELELAGLQALMSAQKQREAAAASAEQVRSQEALQRAHQVPRVALTAASEKIDWSTHKKEGMRLKRLCEDSTEGERYPHMRKLFNEGSKEDWVLCGSHICFQQVHMHNIG